jgi:hypothetical protein
MPDNLLIVDEKKFIWDGIDYASGEEASRKMQTYENEGFEVERNEENAKTCLYTRKIVKATVKA